MKRNMVKSELEKPEIKSSPPYRPLLKAVKSGKEQLQENFASNKFSPEGDWDGLSVYICSLVTEISLEDMDIYLSLS